MGHAVETVMVVIYHDHQAAPDRASCLHVCEAEREHECAYFRESWPFCPIPVPDCDRTFTFLAYKSLLTHP